MGRFSVYILNNANARNFLSLVDLMHLFSRDDCDGRYVVRPRDGRVIDGAEVLVWRIHVGAEYIITAQPACVLHAAVLVRL